jgi:hypothetical protein
VVWTVHVAGLASTLAAAARSAYFAVVMCGTLAAGYDRTARVVEYAISGHSHAQPPSTRKRKINSDPAARQLSEPNVNRDPGET